ncbi:MULTISPECIES: hypothetical protein [unclassified Streptomyces]|uniref:hypothetical protein n=1 Tax=unclassified Streptomyces TaxID=2593676 RepID=UPI0037F21D9D
MNGRTTPLQQPAERVPNGHRYCWAEYGTTGRRCTRFKDHASDSEGGGHEYPYPPVTRW